MKKLIAFIAICLIGISTYAQDWHQVGMNFTTIDKKKVAVTSDGHVGMFVTNTGPNNGFFWIYDPSSMTWTEVTGPFNSQTVMDMNLVTDGTDFYIYHTVSSQDQFVWKINPVSQTPINVSSGLANGIFNFGATDLFVNHSTGDLYLVGLNGDMTDLNVMGFNGSNWDTLQLDFMSAAGASIQFVNMVSGYANGTDVYIGVSANDGSFDGIGLFQAQIGTWNFQFANGLPSFNNNHLANHVDLAGDGNGYPIVVSNNFNVSDSVMYYEYDGGGMNVSSGINMGGPLVTNIEVSFKGGKKMVMVTTDAASDNTKVFEWNGSNFVNAHPSLAGVGTMDDPKSSFAQHPINGKPYVTAEIATDDIRTYALNSTPFIDNIVIKDICLQSFGDIFQPVGVKDDDSDSTWILIRSTNQTMIGDNDLSSNFVSRNGQITSYNGYCAWTNMDGTVMIEIIAYDGITTDTSQHAVTVLPNPSIDASSVMAYPVCSTNGPIDLNTLITPTGGIWSGQAVDQNGMLDPVSAQQNSVVYYDFYDANGCYASEEISLFTVTGPTINPGTATPASCGTANGAAQITVIPGSTNDYFIQWSTGDTNTVSVSNLSQGQYQINVIDTNGCANFLSYIVPSQDIAVAVNPTPPLCQGSATGSIDITVTGNAPFSYYWINGDTTEDLTNVEGGIYTVMITDNNGCTTTELVDLAPLSSQMSIDGWANDGQCMINDGGVQINQVFGGTAPYTFLWSNAQTTQNLTNVAPGVYSVVVTDDNNCTYTDTFTVSTIDGPYLYEESITNVDCNQSNGAIDLGVSWGQNPPTSFSWSNGETTEDITNLNPGTYTVVVTDGAGCEGHASFTVKAIKPDVQPICLVTVDSLTTTNLLVWERVTPTGISHYNIYRETGAANNYPLVGTVSANDESVWNDVSASPLVTSWRYKMTQVDDCGVESDMSLHHKTMHVTINKGLGTTYNIFWDDYEGIAYSTVNLYRYDQTNGITTLATLPSTNNSYTDDPGNDTINLDYFVGFDLAAPCTSSRAQDYNGTRSNRSAGVFDPGDGIDDLSIFENNDLSDMILIYPNPNSGIFTLSFGNTLLGKKEIKVLDSRGKIVAYKSTTSYHYEMNLLNLESGIYFVEVINNNKKGLKKIVIQ